MHQEKKVRNDSAGAIIVLKGDATQEDFLSKCKICVIRSSKSKHGGHSLPKGHIETNESELDAVFREIYEESGIRKDQCECVEKLGKIDISEIRSVHLYLFVIKHSCYSDKNICELVPTDNAIIEAKWVTLQDLLDKKFQMKPCLYSFLCEHIDKIKKLFK